METSVILISSDSYVYVSPVFFASLNRAQLGVSIPLNTRETPVMIISELCSNGDLFDYLRGSQVPAVRRMVSHQAEDT